jgi:hypothetical protein
METACTRARRVFLEEGQPCDEEKQEEEPIRLPLTADPTIVALSQFPVTVEGGISTEFKRCIMLEAC